jgi:hypothetical protein
MLSVDTTVSETRYRFTSVWMRSTTYMYTQIKMTGAPYSCQRREERAYFATGCACQECSDPTRGASAPDGVTEWVALAGTIFENIR